MYLNYYLNLLGVNKIPKFLIKYLNCPSLLRLKKIGYFCGMDYASHNVYNFREIVTRFDHSLSVALLTYKLTKDKKATLAGLFHDISTPCFSHVIDYMNEDYANQESTEEFTEKILLGDKYLSNCLKKDKINIMDIIDFKKYTIVDNSRPKLCADRIDGVILTGMMWTKNLDLPDVKNIVSDLCVFQNEKKELEIGFKSYEIAKKVVLISESIDIICHSNEDNYMMQLVALMTKFAIDNGYISYDDLYYLDEDKIFSIFDTINLPEFKEKYHKFKTIKVENIPPISLPMIKKRDINPLVLGKRFHS